MKARLIDESPKEKKGIHIMAAQKKATYQLSFWEGKFGDEYIGRNAFEKWKVQLGKKAFGRMLKNITVDSILEVGSNIGLNLVYLNAFYNGRVDLFAVEPNKKAFTILSSEKNRNTKNAWNCSAFKMPLEDSSIDLVFTSGVLIHIAPHDLGRATDEICRISKEYILCMEYFSHKPVEETYRGGKGLLFKRDFGSFYLERYPGIKCVNYGFLWKQEFKIFDDLNWWLFKKKNSSK